MGGVRARLRRLAVPGALTMVCVLGLVGAATAATGSTLPDVVLQQAGHWAVDKAQRTVLHVHGGTQQIDASIALPDDAARGALMAVQGATQGFVVGGDRAWSFDKSQLTTAPPVPLPVTDERPVGIETPGGPYLVYRSRGTLVRLGQPAAVVEAGGPVGPPIRTSDGTVWVHRPDSGALCAFRRDTVALDCGASVAAGTTGGLTVLGDRAVFVDVATDVAHLVRAGDQDAGAALGTDLPADALLADQGTTSRLPVVLPGVNTLRLVDSTGVGEGRPSGDALDVSLGAGTFSAPLVSGDVVAVLELGASTLVTFDGQGRRLAELRLPPGTDPADVRRGEDGQIYVDQPDGARTHVIRPDGTISTLDFGLSGGGHGSSPIAVAAPESQRNPIVPPLPGRSSGRAGSLIPDSGSALVPGSGSPPPFPGPGTGTESVGQSGGVGALPGGTTSRVGGSPVQPPPGVPIPPVPVAVVAQLTGPNEIAVSWQASAGATSYTVTGSRGDTLTVTTTRAVVRGLAAGGGYTFRVNAANQVGTSAWSSPSNAIQIPGPADAPSDLRASLQGQSERVAQYQMTWTPPALNGGDLVRYDASLTDRSGTGVEMSEADSEPRYGTVGIDRCLAPYTFTVRALTRLPSGETSSGAAASRSFGESADCSLSGHISGTATSPTTATITMDVTSSTGAGSDCRCSLLFDGVERWSELHNAASFDATVDGLEPGRTYSVQLRMKENVGPTTTSNTITVTTPDS